MLHLACLGMAASNAAMHKMELLIELLVLSWGHTMAAHAAHAAHATWRVHVAPSSGGVRPAVVCMTCCGVGPMLVSGCPGCGCGWWQGISCSTQNMTLGYTQHNACMCQGQFRGIGLLFMTTGLTCGLPCGPQVLGLIYLQAVTLL